MLVLLPELRLPLGADESSLRGIAAGAINIPLQSVGRLQIKRISIDARKKNDIAFNYAVTVELSYEDAVYALKRTVAKAQIVEPDKVREVIMGETPLENPIVVVGMGPAGIFAAYMLAKHGYRPIAIERGKPVEERAADVEAFWAGGALNKESNVLFGEGGAGTFSDGKLTTRIKDSRSQDVLDILMKHGAPKEIGVMAKPHIGTDKLRLVVAAMREEILRYGGSIRHNTAFRALRRKDGGITAIVTDGGEVLRCDACILAIGHSASDTYRMLYENGIEMEAKPYAVGVRIEHPRELIDKSQYGEFVGHPRLGAAEYQMSSRSGGRGVYTFCMCPGGLVVASASDKEQVVTNGMSFHARNGDNSNAAIVVQVDKRDFRADDPLGGLVYREHLEREAFVLGGANFNAPAIRMGDFLSDNNSGRFGAVKPTYRPNVRIASLNGCLPDDILIGIRDGIRAFSRKLNGFDHYDAVLTAVESRTSAPVRILRDENGEATRLKGLYPVGEGAGYAGGIVSAAVDGIRAAERIMGKYRCAL